MKSNIELYHERVKAGLQEPVLPRPTGLLGLGDIYIPGITKRKSGGSLPLWQVIVAQAIWEAEHGR